MKKILLTCMIVCLVATQGFAQTSTFNKKDNVLGIGVGIGTGAGYWVAGYSNTPAIMFNYELCVADNLFDEKSSIGIGGVVGFYSTKFNSYYANYRSNHFTVGVRGAFHYALVNKLDTYAGLMLGYNYNTGIDLYYSYNPDVLAFGLYAGARYYFTDKIAAWGELGFGYSVLNVGVAFKF